MSIPALNPLTCYPGYCLSVPGVMPVTRGSRFLQAMAAPARPLAQAEAFGGTRPFDGFNEKLAFALNRSPRLEILS